MSAVASGVGHPFTSFMSPDDGNLPYTPMINADLVRALFTGESSRTRAVLALDSISTPNDELSSNNDNETVASTFAFVSGKGDFQ